MRSLQIGSSYIGILSLQYAGRLNQGVISHSGIKLEKNIPK